MSKKQKTRHVALDDLSWQPVVRTHAAGLDFDEGLLGLEEVVGVEVAYQQTANGRVATFVVRFFHLSDSKLGHVHDTTLDTTQVDDSKDTSTDVEEQAPPQTTIASKEVTQTVFTELRTVTAFDCMFYYKFGCLSDNR